MSDNEADVAKVPETAPAQEGGEEQHQQFEWSAHYDDEGRIYYYNSVTEESSWEPPPDGKFYPAEEPVSTGEEGETKMEEQGESGERQQESADTPTAALADGAEKAVASESTTSWVAYKDDEGREYYYNTETGETQWEKPDHYVEAPVEEREEPEHLDDVDMAGISQEEADSMDVDSEGKVEPEFAPVENEEAEEEVDPAVKRLQEAEAALSQTDSILEPTCMNNVTEVAASEGGNPQKALSTLIDNYQGQTAVCGLLGRWLADLRSSTTSSSTATAPSDSTLEAAVNQVREAAQDVIYRVAKERFSKETGDKILVLSKAEAAFLEDMIDSPRWRKLLIDLYASHKDSGVLNYCLRAISERGFHREIAKRVNLSDHFAVFNAMLQSELTILGNIAVSAGSDPTSSIGLEELVNDLRRSCSSTSYAYLYSVEALRVLAAKAKNHAENSNSPRFRRAIRKWQALAQNLESVMIDPTTATSVAGSSPLLRKRRLDLALTVSELHQRQRRRRKGQEEHGGSGSDNCNGGQTKKTMETALFEFLRRYSVGTQLDDQTVDPLLPSGFDLDATEDVGKLFVQHPLSVRALLTHLYKPGVTRVTSPVLRNKCGRLVAFAVMAAEKMAQNEAGSRVSEPATSDEVTLTRVIVQGSQLCEQLESVISFSINVDSDKVGPTASPGEKLCSLALQYAPVALGTCIWARSFCQGPEFATSASFATLSTSILSLVRVISVRYPFTRRDALEVALSMAFQSHSNSDISVQKINSIKEQSLRLMIILLVNGEMASVLDNMVKRLQQKGVAQMDASLIRYFVGGILDCVRPPLSKAFVQAFGELLKTPKCPDAIRSTYFPAHHREALKKLLRAFEQVKLVCNGKDGSQDIPTLISSLQDMYK